MIHPTALIDASAELAPDVEVGAYSIIGPKVIIGSGTIVNSHVVIKGPTTIGANNRIFQFSSIGEDCQDLKYNGEPTRLEIGDNNTFREYVTIQRGTVQDNSLTKIGNSNLFMGYTHVAHDCVIGNHCIFANLAQVAGHVKMADYVILGANTIVHQFVQFGSHVMTGMGSVIYKDVPTYMMCHGNPAKAGAINTEGLKRRGFTKAQIKALRDAYKLTYRQGLRLEEAIEQLAELPEQEVVAEFTQSLMGSTRGIVR